MRRIILFLALLNFFCFTGLLAQNIAINNIGASPDSSAILDIQSDTKGLLIPRMTLVQRDLIISPATGLLIYQTDNGRGLYIYNGSGWHLMTSSSNVWSTSGNSGMDPNNDFIGTIDNAPLRIRINNRWSGEVNRLTGNISLGDSSGASVTTGIFNTSIGFKSLRLCNTGYENTALGAYALYRNTSGFYNTALGGSTLFSNTTGHHNVAIGFQTLYENISGDDNTVVGAVAMYYNLEGDRNTAVGRATLQNCTSNNNTAMGYRTMYTSIGGADNTAMGSYAMEFNQYGSHNVALGAYALKDATASYNVAVGSNASPMNTSGNYNVSVGYSSLANNKVGSENTAVGMLSCAACTGFGNTSLGTEALSLGPAGDLNTAIGNFSGTEQEVDNTIGINNWSNHIAFDNYVHIGNLANVWNGGNVTWSTYSDARIKTDIRDDVRGLDFILRLRPVTYHRDIDAQEELNGTTHKFDFPHRYDIEAIKFSGFLAQEVEAAAVASDYDFSGITIPKNDRSVYTLSYESFVVPLVKAVQEQQTIIEQQDQKIQSLEDRLALIESELIKINR